MKHKLTLHIEQITQVTLLHPGNLHQLCFQSHTCIKTDVQMNLNELIYLGSGQLDHVIFANKSFSNREVDNRPGVLSLLLLSFINREFAMLILNNLKGIHSISGILKNFRSHRYNNHDCTTAMSKKNDKVIYGTIS